MVLHRSIWRGPFPRLSPWASQLRKNVAALAQIDDTVSDLTGLGIESRTFCTDTSCASATWPSGIARLLQILSDGFDSRMEPIVFHTIYWVAADRKSASSLRSLSQLPLNFQFNLTITSVIYLLLFIAVS